MLTSKQNNEKVIYNLLLHSAFSGDEQTHPTACRTELVQSEVPINTTAGNGGCIAPGNKLTKDDGARPRELPAAALTRMKRKGSTEKTLLRTASPRQVTAQIRLKRGTRG